MELESSLPFSKKPVPNSKLRQINPAKPFHSLHHLSFLFTPGFLIKICKPFSSLPGVEDSLFLITLPLCNVKCENCENLLQETFCTPTLVPSRAPLPQVVYMTNALLSVHFKWRSAKKNT
jgi:hypothetical protein